MAKKRTGKGKVGYKNPPKEHQFKPGQSGNKNGRPKKSVDLCTLVAEDMAREMSAIGNGEKIKIMRLEALAHQMNNKAIKGDVKAAEFILKLLEKNEQLQKKKQTHTRIDTSKITTLAEAEAAYYALIRRTKVDSEE